MSWQSGKFSFGGGSSFHKSVSPAISLSKKEFKEKIAMLKIYNEKNYKPCPICGNLVRPELQEVHNEAYHSVLTKYEFN